METVSVKSIRQVIACAKRADDAITLRVLGRSVLHTKAAMHAHALAVYKQGEYTDWRQWVKQSLKGVCSAKDIHTITYSAVVLSRLDSLSITLDERRITSWFFITHRLTYLHDALSVLRHLGKSAQDTALFKNVIAAAATLSRDDLRAYLDTLNFKPNKRPACYRHSAGNVVTYTIVCTDVQQAEKLQMRLSLLVAMK